MVDPSITAAVSANIQQLRQLLEGMGDAIAIRDALQQLELSAYRIADAVYGAETSQAGQEGATEMQANKKS
jgi:hypothetical protein